MSYQPQQPIGSIPFGMPPVPPIAAPKKGKGGTIAGLALIVVGLGAGGALIVMSGSNKDETVKKFARAPVGCTTSLQFDKSSDFTLYLETKGKVEDVGGDCTANGSSYDSGNDASPEATLTLVDENDSEVTLDDADGPSYDSGGFAGRGIKRVHIDTAGSYRLTVASDTEGFAIAIGGDPAGDSGTMKTAGIGAAAAGVVLGGLVLLIGRRKGGANVAPSAGWQPAAPTGGWPPQPTVPGYQPAPVAPPTHTPPPAPPVAPPAPPAGPGWGAPHQ